MGFFNALTVRISLGIIGGGLYGLLAYGLVRLLGAPSGAALSVGFLTFAFYVGSRLLLLFSGVDTPYYSKPGRDSEPEKTPFHQAAQRIGRFYHYHDLLLFAFLTLVALGFLLSLAVDGFQGKPFGQTFFDFVHPFFEEF
ncbi:MAG: hypothetical protein N3G78_12055 [Desulfobacterota bacterium]|nr:hypothetical protein [Thermodesulfobacteriota bacterium]